MIRKLLLAAAFALVAAPLVSLHQLARLDAKAPVTLLGDERLRTVSLAPVLPSVLF